MGTMRKPTVRARSVTTPNEVAAFRRGPASGDVADILRKLAPEIPRRTKIRCPKCQWQPEASSRWMCSGAGPPENFPAGCGTAWNSFETRGICPGCDHRWEWTACLACGAWSRHDDWYVEEDADSN